MLVDQAWELVHDGMGLRMDINTWNPDSQRVGSQASMHARGRDCESVRALRLWMGMTENSALACWRTALGSPGTHQNGDCGLLREWEYGM